MDRRALEDHQRGRKEVAETHSVAEEMAVRRLQTATRKLLERVHLRQMLEKGVVDEDQLVRDFEERQKTAEVLSLWLTAGESAASPSGAGTESGTGTAGDAGSPSRGPRTLSRGMSSSLPGSRLFRIRMKDQDEV